MKRKMGFIIIILISVIIIIVSCFLFFNNSDATTKENIADISKIAVQSAISGLIAFLGLFMTMMINDYQRNREEIMETRPYFCVVGKEKASKVLKNLEESDTNDVVCTKDLDVRKIKCEIKNTRDCEVKNLHLNKIQVDKNCNVDGSLICSLVLKNNPKKTNSFKLFYEDRMGIKYVQKIKYKYRPKNTSYYFKSSVPKRK